MGVFLMEISKVGGSLALSIIALREVNIVDDCLEVVVVRDYLWGK